MVFDTTSSNTGHLTARCVSIQRDLGRPTVVYLDHSQEVGISRADRHINVLYAFGLSIPSNPFMDSENLYGFLFLSYDVIVFFIRP